MTAEPVLARTGPCSVRRPLVIVELNNSDSHQAFRRGGRTESPFRHARPGFSGAMGSKKQPVPVLTGNVRREGQRTHGGRLSSRRTTTDNPERRRDHRHSSEKIVV